MKVVLLQGRFYLLALFLKGRNRWAAEGNYENSIVFAFLAFAQPSRDFSAV